LKNFKKPIVESYLDPITKLLVEKIKEIDGVKQFESTPFFQDYQIFISTYDRFWFNVAKNWLENKSENEWNFYELYANKKDDNKFSTPLLFTSLNYQEKADYYYSKHEYPTCANYLRKQLEKRIKELLPPNEHYMEYLDEDTGVKEIKKLKTLNQYLDRFISYCNTNGVNANELKDLKNLKDWYFNPFSHDNIGTPIFKRELDLARILVINLEKFHFNILIEAGSFFYFRFSHEGQDREYKLELLENIRWINCEIGHVLTNPKVRCYEWTKNGKAEKVNWEDTLFHCYNNKWKSLIKQPNIPDFPMEIFWNEIYEKESELPLIAKRL
jgi:hypothetical protein